MTDMHLLTNAWQNFQKDLQQKDGYVMMTDDPLPSEFPNQYVPPILPENRKALIDIMKIIAASDSYDDNNRMFSSLTKGSGREIMDWLIKWLQISQGESTDIKESDLKPLADIKSDLLKALDAIKEYKDPIAEVPSTCSLGSAIKCDHDTVQKWMEEVKETQAMIDKLTCQLKNYEEMNASRDLNIKSCAIKLNEEQIALRTAEELAKLQKEEQQRRDDAAAAATAAALATAAEAAAQAAACPVPPPPVKAPVCTLHHNAETESAQQSCKLVKDKPQRKTRQPSKCRRPIRKNPYEGMPYPYPLPYQPPMMYDDRPGYDYGYGGYQPPRF